MTTLLLAEVALLLTALTTSSLVEGALLLALLRIAELLLALAESLLPLTKACLLLAGNLGLHPVALSQCCQEAESSYRESLFFIAHCFAFGSVLPENSLSVCPFYLNQVPQPKLEQGLIDRVKAPEGDFQLEVYTSRPVF